MADEPSKWHELFVAALEHPEKMALLFVLLAGFWRWIRELLHVSKGETQHEGFVDSLMNRLREAEKENKELREELRKMAKEKPHDD